MLPIRSSLLSAIVWCKPGRLIALGGTPDALIIQVNFIEVEMVENGKIQAKYFLEIDLTP